jgi:hypothetical protein
VFCNASQETVVLLYLLHPFTLQGQLQDVERERRAVQESLSQQQEKQRRADEKAAHERQQQQQALLEMSASLEQTRLELRR